MVAYLFRRIWQGIIVLFGVSIVTFALPSLFSGSVARMVLGQKATPRAVAAFDHQYGYDQPILVQYWHYMVNLFHGNFGISMSREDFGASVASQINEHIWRTLWLSLISLVLALIIAVPLGLYQAIKRNSKFDYSVTAAVFIIYSAPVFLLAIFLISIFSFWLHWLPPLVPESALEANGVFGPLLYMFAHPTGVLLPIMVVTGGSIGYFSRYMRGSVLDTLVQDYIRTAKAKGASGRRLLFKHAFRNAIIPIVTILGLILPGLFGGALFIETIFNYPGMGLLTVQATRVQDLPVIMAATLIIAVTTVIGNFLSDLGIAILDPRIRLTGKR